MENLFYKDKTQTISYEILISKLNNKTQFYKEYFAADYVDFFYNCIYGIITDQKFILKDFIHEKKQNINPDTIHINIENIQDLKDRIRSSKSEIGIYSSGSEGHPKLIFHTVQRLLKSVRIADEYHQTNWGFSYHPAHSAGIQFLLQILSNQATLVNLRNLKTREMVNFMEEARVNYLAGTPTFYRLLAPFDFTINSVNSLTLNGEKSTEKLINDLKKPFPNAKIRNIYGSTEAGPLMSSDSEIFTVPDRLSDKIKIDCGQLYFHTSILSNSLKHITWYPSGDLVDIVSETPLQIKFISRISRNINVGGQMVNPQQIEEVLLNMPGIMDVSVYARPNAVTENLLVANIVPDKYIEINDKAVIRFLKAQAIPAYKIPRIINFIDEISMGRTGKKMIR
jgi:acyl-coenzyme A synthetase/AMP-(fatty) acid ligase